MTQEGWDTPRTDDDLEYERAWEQDRAYALEAEEEERERAQTLIDEAVSDDK